METQDVEFKRRVESIRQSMYRDFYAKNCAGAEPEHLQPPISTLPEHALANSDDAAALETVATAYFEAMPDARYARLADRVATLRENDSMPITGKPPAITICVSAAMGETEQTLAHTLQLVAKQEGAEAAEVLLYANYNADTLTDQAQIANKLAMLARLQADALQGDRPLRVRYLLEGYPDDELAISRIRKDAADVIALDTLERGGNYQHPVLWLDADNARLTPGLLTAHINQQQINGRNLILTTTQNYFSMNDPGQEYQPGDTAQKLAAYNEILRRQAFQRTQDIRPNPYPEENGLSFSIGTYLLVGGFNTGDKLQEARHLLTVIEKPTHAAQAMRVLGDLAIAQRVELPQHLRVYSSGRRHIKHAQQHLTQERPLQHRAEGIKPYTIHDKSTFSGSDDIMRMQNISGRSILPASSSELVRQHVQALTSEYEPRRVTDSAEAAYFTFASRILERLGLTELAEITEVTPDVRPS